MPAWLPPVLAFGFVVAVILTLVAWRFSIYRRLTRRGDYSFEDRPESGASGGTESVFDFSDIRCTHPPLTEQAVISVRGTEVGVLRPGSPICAECMSAWLDRHGTTCATCDGPICPGMPVGQAWNGAPHPHTHMNFECTESGGLWCGRWGKGRLITLHEIDPATYGPGTASAMAHVLKTGKPSSDDIR